MEKICGIYLIESPNKKLYIGQSRDINKRFYGYKLLHCKGQPHLFNSLAKHGVDNHIFTIIETCSWNDLNEAERFYIGYFKYLGFELLNIAFGGDSKESVEKAKITRQKNLEKKEGLSTYDYCHKRLYHYCKLNGYSMTNTYLVYKAILNQILASFGEPENAGLLAIQEFASTFTNDNTRRNICIILRWLFNTVYDKKLDWKELPYPKRKKKVQPVYAEKDIIKVLHSIKNAKQKAILALMIDQGLRVSEPCGILIADCNSKDRKIVIRSAKGDHDRIIYPSPYVWNLIAVYWKEWKKEPTDKYLFDGQDKGKPYTTTSIQAFLKMYCKVAEVEYLGTHAIRRFNGTWSIENHVPLSVTAKKFGHQSTRTLENHYIIHSPTFLKNVASPLA